MNFLYRYQLVRELNSTTTPSLIPLAHTSVLPFLALPAGVLRARVKGIYHLQAMCGMKIRPEESGVKGLSPEEELEGMEREQEKVQLLHLDFHSEHRVTPLYVSSPFPIHPHNDDSTATQIYLPRWFGTSLGV